MHTQRFPKNLRHSYTQKLELMALEFQEALLMANAVRGAERSRWLAEGDGRLVCLRALIRLAHALQLFGGNQIKYAAERMAELGRLEEGAGSHSAGSFRVNRGGGFHNAPRNCRCANRNRNAPSNRNCNPGFRVVLVR
jgi:hypothetical protein